MTNIQCWNSKEWKTEVKTEMCENCIKTMKEEIKTFYANVDNNFEHENEEIPKRKNNLKSKLSQKTSLMPLNEVLLLNNSLKVDNFLISAINAIDLMPALKNSIISNTGNITHKELTKILQREMKDVQKLRETITEYTSDFREDASAALEKLLAMIDKNSQELLQFTYNSTQQCECQLLNCSNVEKCVILHLTIAENSTASKITFKDMLNSWEQIDRGSCVTCNSTKIGKYTVVFGNKQKYFAVEINAWKKTSKGMKQKVVSSDNFNINEQLIFGKLWKLIGAIQYNDNIKHYITWKRDVGEKWIIIDDNKKSVKKELYKNLSNYRMLIFERLNVVFVDPENLLASRVEAHQQHIPGNINQRD
uniref:USP domain-containing protein n=1 Tax=Panagrolaimus davidi TaxID=227884 RepID=A0A914Q1W0_9BILA